LDTGIGLRFDTSETSGATPARPNGGRHESIDRCADGGDDDGHVSARHGGRGRQMLITKVIDGSPAQNAGFEIGDALVAVNGVAFSDENEKQIKDIQYSMIPGADFTYTVSRKGSKVDLDVELGELPDNVKAQWIGNHMVDHAELQMASNE
jgi:S1-C subfamily serine protease